MKRINFFKKIYYSIIGKKYKEMVEEKSAYAILYLAIFELGFTVLISRAILSPWATCSLKRWMHRAKEGPPA